MSKKRAEMWFTPRYPIDEESQEWLEDALLWMLDEFSPEPLRAPVVLPDTHFFPDPYSGHPQDAQRLLERVCGYMRADPQRIRLEFYDEHPNASLWEKLPHQESLPIMTAGHYREVDGQAIIGLEVAQLRNTMSLVATMAHEIGHLLLLGDGRVSAEEEDHEPLTDLLTVFFGMGIFSANSAVQFRQWSDPGGVGWEARALGYLSEEMFGCALASCAWMRGESSPPWAEYLGSGVRTYKNQCLRYLEKTENTRLPRSIAAADSA